MKLKFACLQILLLLGLLVCNPASAWYDNQWTYRVPITIPAGAAVNSTVKVDVDFAALLTTLGASGTFDVNSPRLVRSNDTTLVTTQEFTDTVYNAATDAANNARGEIRFILQDAGATTYYLYFDIQANGPKAANPQTRINGNFESGTTGTLLPIGWGAATRSASTMDLQVRPSETVTVAESSGTPSSVSTNGTPNTGAFAYLMGFRTNSDSSAASGTNAVLRRDFVVPSSNPGSIRVNLKPQGWDSGTNGNLSSYDYLQVRLLNPTTSAVLLNIVGPQMNNYGTCPYSPNYGTNQASATTPGYGYYNYWDNETDRNNHTQGLGSLFDRGLQPWVSCSASLSALAGTTVRLEIRMSVVSLYRSWYLIDDVEWSVITGTLGAPQTLTVAVAPSSFNAFETSTPANSVTGVLTTKLAGTAFGFDVVALSSTPSVLSSFTGPVKVELVDGNAASCAASTSIQTVTASYSYVGGDQGRHTFSGVTQATAYPNLMVRMSYPATSPTVVACSTDHFSIRPSSFTIDSGANADAAGSSSTATPAIKTNAAFSLTATSDALGYNGTPKLDSSRVSAHGGAVQSGTLSGSFNPATAATGIASGSSFSYSEVGYFKLAAQGVYDDTFTAIDSASGDCSDDFSNSLVGGEYGCKFGNTVDTSYFGRFIPDHLTAQLLGNGTFAHACGSFSYNGQAIGYASGNHPMLGITAYNAASPAAITQNYTGSFARLQANQVSMTTPTSDALKKGADNSNLLRLTAAMATPSLTDNGDGSLTLILGNDSFTYQRENNALVAPFANSIAIPVTAISDSDGVVATNLPITLQPAGESIYYGRINLMNANGSELEDLAMGMNAEYFNGSSFVANAGDQCSVASLSIADPLTGDSLTPTDTCVWDNGNLSGSFKCAASAASGLSYREGAGLIAGNFNLYLKAPGKTGSLTVNASVADWLKYNWLGGGQINPSATATFGIFKGKDQLIYFREVY